MEQWNHSINSIQGNEATGVSSSLYKASAQVTQFSKTGEILRVYDFMGLYYSRSRHIDLTGTQKQYKNIQ